MVVAVAGAVDHELVVAEVERRFPDAPPRRPARSATTHHRTPRVVVDRRRSEQAQVALGFRGLARDDRDREALDVVNHVLGGGLSSRLFEEIREQRGLAYAVGSGTSSFTDAGSLTIYAGTGPSQVPEVLRLIDVEVAKLITDGITADELEVAAGYLTGAYVMGLEDTGSRMAQARRAADHRWLHPLRGGAGGPLALRDRRRRDQGDRAGPGPASIPGGGRASHRSGRARREAPPLRVMRCAAPFAWHSWSPGSTMSSRPPWMH